MSILKSAKHYGFICSAVFYSLSTQQVFAEHVAPIALMGGQGNAPYAAFIQSDGTVTPIQGLPPTGLTFRVAFNSSREGLIGGTDALDAYAAFVDSQGSLTPIPGLIAPGEIYTVSINESGNGMIGGGHLISNTPYAALVFPNGTAIPFIGLPASGLIYGVEIEEGGNGIIGGVGPLDSAYAALVASDGTLTPLAGLPASGGIFWVAANDSGTKFIGGKDNASVYAAFVDPSGALSPVAGLPSGLLYSVDINNKGSGIIAGASLNLPYAALVSPSGAATTIADLPTGVGIIYNSAINNSGTGLIAGFSATQPFGGFVSPTGTLIPLINLPSGPGFLDGAALHSSGVGIVGGTSGGVPFAALAAPNGRLTYLSGLPSQGEINSIAIAALDGLVPKSIGPSDSWANTQFALSNTLTQHCMLHHKNQDVVCADQGCELYSLWVSPFGNYVRDKSQHNYSTLTNKIGGALLGFDYLGVQDIVLGGGFGYAYNHAEFNHNTAKINQESGVLYASINKPNFYLNAALWAGGSQTSNTRKSLGFITSKSNPHAWNITPHLELSTPFTITPCQLGIDPFVAFDWANNWQDHYRERGISGFNLILDNQYASVLRSEVGIRFLESFCYDWGILVLAEKGSYVNRTPFHHGNNSASFVGAFSSFNVNTFPTKSQNHGLVELHVECLPNLMNSVYASIDYQGEFGCSFQSQSLTLSLGKNF